MPDKEDIEIQEAVESIAKGQPRSKLKGCLRVLIIILIILAIAAAVVYFLFFSSFAFPGTGLKGESSGQINVLVLGRGGDDHTAGDLTDTIMLVMIRPKENRVGMLSIPRDLWINDDEYGGMKINALYSAAKNNGDSDKKAIKRVEGQVIDITGFKPHYYALIDFEGLSEIVDTLGGVDVNVDTAFTDTLHHIDYPKGSNHFDGDEAVMYTRARYATSGEGSDFQRADRQQDLILAIKNEALSSATVFSPSKLSSLSKQYKQHIITDISIRELSRMKVLAGDLSDKNTTKAVYSTSNVLVSGSSSGGAYILQPKSGDWSETKSFAKNLFKDNPTVQVLNGTKEVGKATVESDHLLASGFNIVSPADADKNIYIQTLVYDNSGGKYTKTAKNLAKTYKGKIIDDEQYSDSSADIVVVLGGKEERKKSLWQQTVSFLTGPIAPDGSK